MRAATKAGKIIPLKLHARFELYTRVISYEASKNVRKKSKREEKKKKKRKKELLQQKSSLVLRSSYSYVSNSDKKQKSATRFLVRTCVQPFSLVGKIARTKITSVSKSRGVSKIFREWSKLIRRRTNKFYLLELNSSFRAAL